MNHDAQYQTIFDKMEEFLPIDWNTFIFYAEYGENSFSMEFYVRKQDGKYIKCFDLPGINEDHLLNVFQEINHLIRPERDSLKPEKRWSNMTMTVEHMGKFKVDYDYTDLLEMAYEYHNAWKEKYLI